MQRQFRFGDWVMAGNKVHFVLDATDSQVLVWRSGTGSTGFFGVRDIEHLPNCTGFDWQPPKPIEPPPGYRLMGKDEIVKNGDKYLCGEDWHYACVHGDTVEKLKHPSTLAYARKIEPQYRPFASAAEFRQHRLRWWRYKDETVTRPPEAYGDTTNWVLRFDNREFEDGTPFGIETEKEATCAK